MTDTHKKFFDYLLLQFSVTAERTGKVGRFFYCFLYRVNDEIATATCALKPQAMNPIHRGLIEFIKFVMDKRRALRPECLCSRDKAWIEGKEISHPLPIVGKPGLMTTWADDFIGFCNLIKSILAEIKRRKTLLANKGGMLRKHLCPYPRIILSEETP